jgi:signal transduction histidine kinase
LKSRAPDLNGLSYRFAMVAVASGAVLIAIFSTLFLRFRTELRDDIHRKIIERTAAILYPEARQQLIETEESRGTAPNPAEILPVVLKTKQQEGMLAVTIFDAEGSTLQAVGSSLLLPELPPEDYPRLLGGESISRYHADFPLDRYFAGIGGPPEQRRIPVLEVMLPLRGRDPTRLLGFVQYYLDARPLALELAAIDARVNRQTAGTLGIGAALIAGVVTAAAFGLRRAQRVIAERNERLVRANFELTLAVKASAVGQITAHLIHGLQGPVTGLRAIVAEHQNSGPEWQNAAAYIARLQAMIEETVTLLGDTRTQTVYELAGTELGRMIRRHSAENAASKGVAFDVDVDLTAKLDNRRGSLLCLIATNLAANAINATPVGGAVRVTLAQRDHEVTLTVIDQGSGIAESVRARLFEPGVTSRPGGTGIGLALSQLLARQIGANLALTETGPGGTTFAMTMPLD